MSIPHPDVPLFSGRYAPEIFTVGSRWRVTVGRDNGDVMARNGDDRIVKAIDGGRVVFNRASMSVDPTRDTIEEIAPDLLRIIYRGFYGEKDPYTYRRIDEQRKLF